MTRTLIINPRTDPAFVATVESEGQHSPTPDNLESRLHALYPKAVVRPRQLANEAMDIWYVYRDGRWVPST